MIIDAGNEALVANSTLLTARAWLDAECPGWTMWRKRNPDPDNSGWEGSQFTARFVFMAFKAGHDAALSADHPTRQALAFYADPDSDGYRVNVTNYGLSTEDGEIVRDGGKRARDALRCYDGVRASADEIARADEFEANGWKVSRFPSGALSSATKVKGRSPTDSAQDTPEERAYRLGYLRAKTPDGWDEQDDITHGDLIFDNQMQSDLESEYPRDTQPLKPAPRNSRELIQWARENVAGIDAIQRLLVDPDIADLTKPISGIQYRQPSEVRDIMFDRIQGYFAGVRPQSEPAQ